MKGPCGAGDCSFNVTGVCVRGLAVDICPNRAEVAGDGLRSETAEEPDFEDRFAGSTDSLRSDRVRSDMIGGAVLAAPDDLPRLPASRTLGIAEANDLMQSRATELLGIVGLPGAGKTACLVSAYLLLSHGEFDGYNYADSLTLRAFEELARGSRTWSAGGPPDQITAHTTMTDDREAGFLHLRMRRSAGRQAFDVLLPDLPGEWSSGLINRDDGARLRFLRSASVIWLMVDGRKFVDRALVAFERHQAQILIERLAGLLGSARPRLFLVPTWQDAGAFPQEEAEVLRIEAAKWGFAFDLLPVASFSWSDDIVPGAGVATLVHRSLSIGGVVPPLWPVEAAAPRSRWLAAFRSAA